MDALEISEQTEIRTVTVVGEAVHQSLVVAARSATVASSALAGRAQEQLSGVKIVPR